MEKIKNNIKENAAIYLVLFVTYLIFAIFISPLFFYYSICNYHVYAYTTQDEIFKMYKEYLNEMAVAIEKEAKEDQNEDKF
jgi:hypothetical protein